MNKKTISYLLKSMLILLMLTGSGCIAGMKRIVDYLLPGFSRITHTYWIIFFIICAVPCFISLIPVWKISTNIGNNKAFCKENAKHMHLIGILTAADTVFIFIMNIAFYIMGRSFFAFFVSFFLIFAIFFALSVCSFALSSLLHNASELQYQSDFTI